MLQESIFIINISAVGESYLNMLQNYLLPIIKTMTLTERILLWFQQDGAPAHYAQQVKAFLNEKFFSQWIGRGGPIEWPPRSPDLTPLDFFLWGNLS